MNPNHIYEKYISYIKNIQQYSPKTIQNKTCYLKKFITSVDCEDITKLTIYEVDDYLVERSCNLKPESINTERRILRAYFRFAEEYLKLSLQVDYRLIKEVRAGMRKIETFEPKQIKKVIRACRDKQSKLMIATLFEAGLRISELLYLTAEDLTDNRLQIRGKGGKVRLTFVTPRLANQLTNFLESEGIYSGYVFRNKHNEPYHVDTVRKRIKSAFNKVGLQMHPHQLRHSFATDLLNQGADPRSVQKLLGHANLNTTMRYLQVTDKHLEGIFNTHRRFSVA